MHRLALALLLCASLGWTDTSPVDRAVAEWVEKELASRPEGWSELHSDHYVLLTDAKSKYSRRILAHAEAIRAHLDQTYAYLIRRPAPPAVIRLFAEEGDYQSFTRTKGDQSLERILLVVEFGGKAEWELGKLGQRLVDQWLFYGNPHLREVLPYWLKEGLRRHIGWSVPAGKSIRFKLDPYNHKMIREHIRLGRAQPLAEWLGGPDPVTVHDESSRLAGSLIDWLETRARAPWDTLVRDYAAALAAGVTEVERELTLRPDEMLLRDRQGRRELAEELARRAPALRRHAFATVFGSWDEQGWARLEKAWLRHAR